MNSSAAYLDTLKREEFANDARIEAESLERAARQAAAARRALQAAELRARRAIRPLASGVHVQVRERSAR
jgi:hypothetical protein